MEIRTIERLPPGSSAKTASTSAGSVGERFLHEMVDAMPGMIAYWDADLRCRFANAAYLGWFGREPRALIGTTMQELMGPELFAKNEPYVRGALAGEKQCFERTLTRANASIGHTLANYIPDIGDDGTVRGFSVLVSDVTQLKEAEEKLLLAGTIMEKTVEGIFVADADERIISVNPAFTTITEYDADEAIGQTPRLLKSNRHDRSFYDEMWSEIRTTGHWQGQIWNRRKHGEAYLASQTITQIRSTIDQSILYVSMFNDVTELWRKNDELRHLAFHDSLTDLPNRALLTDRLTYQIEMAERDAGSVAVLFLDLDSFKDINDVFGHDGGDELLRVVAQRLQRCVRRSDTVARLGGDEFVIVLYSPGNSVEVACTARAIIAAINEPIQLRETTVAVGISIGIAVFPNDGRNAADILKHADEAMYAAKRAGKKQHAFYDEATAASNN